MNNVLNSTFGNWRTTLFGVLNALMTFFLLGPGANGMPQNRQEWFGLIGAIGQIVWGSVMKDGATGSKATL